MSFSHQSMTKLRSLFMIILNFFSIPHSTVAEPLESMLCGLCEAIRFTNDCSRFGSNACELINKDNVGTCWEQYCSPSVTDLGDMVDEDGSGSGIKDFLGENNIDDGDIVQSKTDSESEKSDHKTTVSFQPLDFKFTKAMASRGNYNLVRLTVIGNHNSGPAIKKNESNITWDYQGQFKWVWTDKYTQTKIIDVSQINNKDSEISKDSNSNDKFDQLIGHPKLPPQGQGTAGLLIADPCIRDTSFTTWVSCKYAEILQTKTRTPEIINMFVGQEVSDGGDAKLGVPIQDMGFWGILGDNFYDRKGQQTSHFWSQQLNVEVKKKLFLTVHGNHDYWVLGSPEISTTLDQCGNGLAQYYGMDTISSVQQQLLSNQSSDTVNINPYDLSINPTSGHYLFGCNALKQSNTAFYNQIGNILFVGFASVYTWNENKDVLTEACDYGLREESVDVLILVGHWSFCRSGCAFDEEDSSPNHLPGIAQKMIERIPSCTKLSKNNNRIKHIMGHTHKNNFNITDPTSGLIVAGFGMEGGGDYGVPIVDTSGERYRVWYFAISNRPGYEYYEEFKNGKQSSHLLNVEDGSWPTLEKAVADYEQKPEHTSDKYDSWIMEWWDYLIGGDNRDDSIVLDKEKVEERKRWEKEHGKTVLENNKFSNYGEKITLSDVIKTTDSRYDKIMECMKKNNTWRKCTHLAELWVDDPLPKRKKYSESEEGLFQI